MKFVVSSTTLLKQLQAISGALQSSTPLPILENFLFELNPGELKASASDLETASKAHFAADVKEPGKVLVPGKLLAEISRSLPNKPITFALDGSRVLVTSGSAKFTLPTLSVDEYPNLPELPDSTGTVPSDTFATAVAQVAIAAGRDD
jgi:DNA polymerase-3 subunit beta